jgi:hypothetical protein
MLIIQPHSQALKVFKHFILAFQEENPRVTRIIVNDDKNIPLAVHRANPRRANSVHMEQLSELLSHHGINRRIRSSDYLALTTRSTNKVTLKLWVRAILGVGLSIWVNIVSRNSDDLISYATSRAQKKTERANASKKIEQVRNQLEKTFPMWEITQTRIPAELRTCESNFQKSTCKSASTS